MSYDLYCYRSPSGNPSVEEAQSVLEQKDKPLLTPDESEFMETIAGQTLEFFPKLSRFEFDYDEIAETLNISREEAMRKVQYIELCPDEDETEETVIIDIERDHVSLNFPFSTSEEVTNRIAEYAVFLHEEHGLTIYDPQSDSIHGSDYLTGSAPEENAKPWWKFW